jgi:GTP pyrophosphokinase
VPKDVTLSPELLELLERHVPAGTTVPTLADGRPNLVVAIDEKGLLVTTRASKRKGRDPQRVEAWMLQTAWDHLITTGSLTNKELLADDGLNVKRSSAVCAVLACLPGVAVASSPPIELRYREREPDVVERAFRVAREVHGDQVRKGSSIPYIAHLMSTAAIVWEHGGTDEHAAAGLLHDYVEDQGGTAALARLRQEFADHPLVVEIVEGCSDAVPMPGEDKAPWVQRKVAYLSHLGEQSTHVLLVSAADKLHNARSTLADYRVIQEELWARFNMGRAYQLWYYEELARTFSTLLPGPLSDELDRTVAELRRLVAVEVPSIDAEVTEVRGRLADPG